MIVSAARKVTAVADHYTMRMARHVMAAFNTVKTDVNMHVLEMLLLHGSTLQNLEAYVGTVLASLDSSLRSASSPVLQVHGRLFDDMVNIQVAAARAVAGEFTVFQTKLRAAKKTTLAKPKKVTVQPPLMAFDAVNPEAVRWAERHVAKLVTEVTAATRRAIRNVIAQAIEEGIAPRDAARLIEVSVSLTEQQANAVVNLHQRIITSPGKRVMAGKTPIRVPAEGISDARLDKVLRAYADRLRRERALNIARTETIAASNQGQTLLWKQAMRAGNLPKTLQRVWIAAGSERTCPQCMLLDGEVIPMDGSWGGLDDPPAHPRCRCTTGLTD